MAVPFFDRLKDACGYDVGDDDCQVIFLGAVTEMQDEHRGLTVKDLNFAVWSHHRLRGDKQSQICTLNGA